AVDAGDDHVADVGREAIEKAGAERADADPRAARHLEVLGQAAVEGEAVPDVAPVDEAESVAGAIEAFLVEGGLGQGGLAPVAGRDVRTAEARFKLVADWRELELQARHRHADMAGAGGVLVAGHGEGRALGRTEAGQHEDTLAAGADRDLVERLPD